MERAGSLCHIAQNKVSLTRKPRSATGGVFVVLHQDFALSDGLSAVLKFPLLCT